MSYQGMGLGLSLAVVIGFSIYGVVCPNSTMLTGHCLSGQESAPDCYALRHGGVGGLLGIKVGSGAALWIPDFAGMGARRIAEAGLPDM